MILRAFSFPVNAVHLFQKTPSAEPDPLAALNGVRVLSMVLIILGHAVLFQEIPGPGFINLGE